MKAAADLPESGGELFRNPGPELRRGMEALLPLIEKTFPIPARFRRTVPRDVAELSRLLTSGRGGRPLAYLNHPPALSAYLRYFLPWNVYRLCRLLPALKLPLTPGDRIADLGAGPLTLPIALWLCRPELRALPLEFRCLDRSKAVLDAGKKLFAALAGSGIFPGAAWTFTAVSGELGQTLAHGSAGGGKGPALTAVLNVYNEIFQSIPPGDDEGLSRFAGVQAALLAAYAGREGRILIVEPGVPRSGRFITLLRDALAALGFPPDSPCVHSGPCPFPGPERNIRTLGPPRRDSSGRGRADRAAAGWDAEGRAAEKTASKWCHFAFDTQDAPAALLRLSAEAGLPKDRAVLSFLSAGPAEGEEIRSADAGFPVRIISDPFPVGGGQGEWGRYGCAEGGMVLVRGGGGRIKSLSSGILVEAVSTGLRDPKSGALICRDKRTES